MSELTDYGVEVVERKEYDDFSSAIAWGVSDTYYVHCMLKRKFPNEEFKGVWESPEDPRYLLLYKVNGVGLIIIRPVDFNSFKKYECINCYKKSVDDEGEDITAECVKQGVFTKEQLGPKS